MVTIVTNYSCGRCRWWHPFFDEARRCEESHGPAPRIDARSDETTKIGSARRAKAEKAPKGNQHDTH